MIPKVQVANVRTCKGPCIYVGRAMPGRPGHLFANPFNLPKNASRADRDLCLGRYSDWLDNLLESSQSARREMGRLAAKVKMTSWPLGCWCDPEPCHAHVLAKKIEEIWERLGYTGGQS